MGWSLLIISNNVDILDERLPFCQDINADLSYSYLQILIGKAAAGWRQAMFSS
jgi:hypothetical protein